MNFGEAIMILLEAGPLLPEDRRAVHEEAVIRVQRRAAARRGANKALPFTPDKQREVRALRGADPEMRLADIAEKTGCSFHDISVFLNAARP